MQIPVTRDNIPHSDENLEFLLEVRASSSILDSVQNSATIHCSKQQPGSNWKDFNQASATHGYHG